MFKSAPFYPYVSFYLRPVDGVSLDARDHSENFQHRDDRNMILSASLFSYVRKPKVSSLEYFKFQPINNQQDENNGQEARSQ